MSLKNKVIAGDFEGKMVYKFFGTPCISINLLESIDLNKKTVKEYEIMNETHRKVPLVQ